MKYRLVVAILFFSSGFSCYSQEEWDNQKINEVLMRKDRALIIANDVYDDFPQLNNPIDDALTVANELRERYGFEVELLQDATVDDTYRKLREYALKKYNPNDQLMVFFAGHGIFDEVFNEGFLVGTDSKKDDESYNSYISHSRLRTIVENIPCEHILLIMDACYSGTFNPNLSRSDSFDELENFEYIRSKLKYKTRLYLTSGGKQYVSDGKKGEHSPFARKLLESLRSNGGQDKVLTFSEIKQNVEKVKPFPHHGEFGSNEPGSDFMFISTGIKLSGEELDNESLGIVNRQRGGRERVYVQAGILTNMKEGGSSFISMNYRLVKGLSLGIEYGSLWTDLENQYVTLDGFSAIDDPIRLEEKYIGLTLGYDFRLAFLGLQPGVMAGVVSGEFSYQLNTTIHLVEFRRWELNFKAAYQGFTVDTATRVFNQYGNATFDHGRRKEALIFIGAGLAYRFK